MSTPLTEPLEEMVTLELEDSQFQSPQPSHPLHQEYQISNRKRQKYIHTKYGSIECNFERILSFLIMLLAILSLLSLSIITIYAIFLRAYGIAHVYDFGTDAIVESNQLITFLQIIQFSSNSTIDNSWLIKINQTFANFQFSSLMTITYSSESSENGMEKKEKRRSIIAEMQDSYDYLYGLIITNRTLAFEYYSNHFVSNIKNNVLKGFFELAFQESDDNDALETKFMKDTAITGTIVCGISLLLIIPISFLATFGRNNKILEKLQKVNAKEVLKTILDPYISVLFQEHCKKHQELKYFLFLEKSLLYTEYCNEIFNLNSIESYLNIDSNNPTELQIDEFESKKCEIVFEILTEFLSSKGEYFLGVNKIGGKKLISKVKKQFKSNPMNLPENLFDEMETNISIHLFPTLKSFQSHQKHKKFIIK